MTLARGRKPLDPDEKAERRQASLVKYREKKGEELRAAARLRMQKCAAVCSLLLLVLIVPHPSLLEIARHLWRPMRQPYADTNAWLGSPRQSTATGERPRLRTTALHISNGPLSNRKKIRASDTERRAQKRLEHSAEEESTKQDPKGSCAPGFGVRAPRAMPDECREGCGEIACEGCACICTASSRWLEHQHYRTDAWHAAGCPA
ncbi:hypothetical protein B0H15DRAFT_943711 [Mycena belliarum]|uniref:Uncharacterized protein n=1 Tax=Mycena belliarum TaxID=1033014 RepID=A0AAD6UG55_9AGAR|nr:hypothetical protein B0H15DRAFT_943711 [Mycena belliae]